MKNPTPVLLCAFLLHACATPAASFASPQEAVQALLDSADDHARAEELLGPGGFEVLRSGDEIADREDADHVRALIRQRVDFEADGDDRRIALLGDDAWPLPLPLVRDGTRWRFDVAAGKEEILTRRIGRNELSTIATLRACVDAQFEYAAEGRDGNPPRFAARWASSEGKHDGLYWPVAAAQPQSPLGPLVAAAAAAGYGPSQDGSPAAYQGYFFRMLDAQGPNAPGGARSYLDEQGRLTTGFAFVAWPATYGNSGIMTFVVDRHGILFERDFGAATAQEVQRITSYDPGSGWSPVGG